VNNILHSAFESVRLFINDTLISTASKHYPYKAYINTALSFPDTSKDNQEIQELIKFDNVAFRNILAANLNLKIRYLKKYF
jgi:hypothetical protein